MMNLVFHIAPAGGIRWSCRSRFGIVYFNSRPRVGGVEAPLVRLVDCLISILAPAWGASAEHLIEVETDAISILAPAWGASAGG